MFLFLTKTEFQPNYGQLCDIQCFTTDSVFLGQFHNSVVAEIIGPYIHIPMAQPSGTPLLVLIILLLTISCNFVTFLYIIEVWPEFIVSILSLLDRFFWLTSSSLQEARIQKLPEHFSSVCNTSPLQHPVVQPLHIIVK